MFRKYLPVVSNRQKNELYASVKRDTAGDFGYYFLVALAAIVASFGLLLNSAAIIIGAMLISPIMKPILGMSFSITTGDSKLFSRAIASILFGSLFAITISIIITLIVPTRALTSEILARTQPTIIDLFVAFASGAAGAFILQNNKDLTVLPGVAIATALMPPLCVVGAGIAMRDFSVALGGFLLFLSNFIAINLAAALIFKLVGITTKDEITVTDDDGVVTVVKHRKGRMLWSITAFVIISIPLSYFLYNTINTEATDKTIDTSLKTVINTYENVDLVNYSYKYADNKYAINAVVRSDKELYGSDIISMENYLERVLSKPTAITLKIIFATDVTALTTPAPLPSPEPAPSPTPSGTEAEASPSPSSDVPPAQSPAANDSAGGTSTSLTVTNPDKYIQYTLEDKCRLINAELIDFNFSYSSQSAIYTINATISGDDGKIGTITDSITTVLEDNLNRKIKLVITVLSDAVPSETPAQATVEPSDSIYDISPQA